MGKYSDIDHTVQEMISDLHRFADRVLQELNKETSKAVKEAQKEFGIYQQKVIREIFNDAVNTFYDAYTPKMYHRTRGLYDVLDMKLDMNGMVITGPRGDYRPLFNSSMMHGDRSGGDLFEKVFMQGYHGGAESIDGNKADIWGVHPAPGVPYYRAPGFVKYPGEKRKKWHKYGKWGKSAVKTISPYHIIKRDFGAIEYTDMFEKFKATVHKHNDAAVDRVKKNIPRLRAEVYK